MSTAGKVLIGFVLVVALAWIALVAGVAQLNNNWTQVIAKNNKEIEDLEKEIAANRDEIQSLKDRVSLQQSAADEIQTVLRSQLTRAERQKAEMIEIQTRVKLELESLLAALKTAESARDLRKEELAKEKTEIATLEMEVEKVKGENATLLTELLGLRKEFKETLAANEALLKKARAQSTTRRTSLAR
jgi:chromosome segregation ATPase